VALALVLRAPWLAEPLGNDEGGLLYVAETWTSGGPFAYGDYFLDRPPLLVLLFRMAAETAGVDAVRAVGAVAVAALVALVTLVGRELGGASAARWAAVLTAVLGSSLALSSVFTPAELIAALPSTASVLLLLVALRRPRARPLLLAGAGALAVAALLVKQSFVDALIAGLVFLVASAWFDRRAARPRFADAGAYLCGAAVPIAGLVLWHQLAGLPTGSLAYALVGFRLDGLGTLSGSPGDLLGRFGTRLLLPLAASGLLVVAAWAVPGVARLRERPIACAAIAAWGLAGTMAILLGGSYWAHYAIQVVPVSAAAAGLALSAARPALARATAAMLTLLVAGELLVGPSVRTALARDLGAHAVAAFVRDQSQARDTIYVRYSQANISYYSGLRNPYSYQWSLMLRTIPGAERQLRTLLASSRRPTWVVEWEPATAYGLDRSGATTRILDRRYREVATVCGYPILLERGVARPGSEATEADCG
jgi:hypothetical protein